MSDDPKDLDWQDVLSFGKHKGETVGNVFDNDPSYLDYLIEHNIAYFCAHVVAALDSNDFNHRDYQG